MPERDGEPSRAHGAIRRSDFRAPWWLRSPHLQTLWPTLARRAPRCTLRRERLVLADGDFVDLDWGGPSEGPVVLVLHGLEGSSRSPYARGLLAAGAARGWRVAIMHFRGCSGEPNRAPRTYHSGETGDLDEVVNRLSRRERTPMAAVGYSLGGNVLLKWLGERGAGAPLAAAVAVSVPMVLARAADRLERGASRLYAWWLLRGLRAKVRARLERGPLPGVDARAVAGARTMRAFDEAATAPLHGFAGAEDYYARASARPHLGRIAVPTLVVHALDDPFMTPDVVPCARELSPAVTVELSAHGGHVGFVQARGLRVGYWLEERIPTFLEPHLGSVPAGGGGARR